MISYPIFKGTLKTCGWFSNDCQVQCTYNSDGSLSISQTTTTPLWTDPTREAEKTNQTVWLKVDDLKMIIAKYESFNESKWHPYNYDGRAMNWDQIHARDPLSVATAEPVPFPDIVIPEFTVPKVVLPELS
jgi:hypothetical protein